MAYLSSLALKNFRTFQDAAAFEFAPLTIVTGPNSSGKSSLLKALLLLQDNIQRTQMWSLRFSGQVHKTTSYESILSRGAEPPIVFTIGLDNVFDDDLPVQLPGSDVESVEWAPPERVYLRFYMGPGHIEKMEIGVPDHARDDAKVLCVVEIQKREQRFLDHNDEVDSFYSFSCSVRVNYPWFYDRLGGELGSVAQSLGLTLESAVLNFVEELQNVRGLQISGLGEEGRVFLDRVTGSIGVNFKKEPDEEWEKYHNAFRQHTVAPVVRACTDALQNVLGSVERIGGRQHPARRVFQVDDRDNTFFQMLDEYLGLEEQKKMGGQWLDKFGIGEAVVIRRIPDVGITVGLERDGDVISMADVGYGHARLLPLIFHTRLRRERATLLVEEPETNLHPNLQSKLADLFLDLIGEVDDYPSDWSFMDKFVKEPALNTLTKRLIVETHSEYLIRRLQYLVATGEADPERIAIYYLGADPEADDYVRRIQITESGQLSDELGPGFLDEATNLMVDLYNYGSQN